MVVEKGQVRQGMRTAWTALLAFVALLVVNGVTSQVTVRFDLTADKIYTLSPASARVVGELAEPVTVYAFVSPNLPPPFHTLEQQVGELLQEYAAASGGRLSFQVITPEADPSLEQVAASYGVRRVAIGQQTDSAVSYRAIYKGLAFVQGDRVETIGDLRVSSGGGTEHFEYEITRALMNLGRQEPRRVVFVGGAGGPADQPGFEEAANQLFGQFFGSLLRASVVELGAARELGEDVSAVVILNVEGDLSAEALFVLDQYLQSGGNVAWFQSGSVYDEARQRGFMEEMQAEGLSGPAPQLRKPLSSNVVEFFETLGVRLGADAVLDRQRGLAVGMTMTEFGPAQVSHPGTFSITSISREVSFARFFSTLALPLPATVEVDRAVLGGQVEVTELLRTEASAVRWDPPPAVALYEKVSRPRRDEEPGPFVIAAVLEGPLPTYYRDAPLPAGRRERDLIVEAQAARLLVVGSGDMVAAYPEAGYEAQLAALGMQFFLESIAWLAQEEALAEIRGRAMPRLLTDVPMELQRRIQWINILFVPAFFATLGIYMGLRRRRRRDELAALGMPEDEPTEEMEGSDERGE